jgi:uncharacterized protein YkwD
MKTGALPKLSLISALAIAGCTQQPRDRAALTLNPAEAAMVNAINDYRAQRNLPVLAADARLCAAAGEHNRVMRDRIALLGLEAGTTHWGKLGQRLQDAGYPFTFAGENVAAGRGVAAPQLFQGLLDSPSHHANIVSTRAQAVGVSVWREGDSVFVTQEFAAP